MRQFGSGILGCIICIVALMGSILGGFILDVNAETRETTNYNYITDITGLFDTEKTPQYVDYSPSTNFTGYDMQTMKFTDSSVPNAYRYVLDSGLVRNIDTNVNSIYRQLDSSVKSNFEWGNLYTPHLIKYNGTKYDFGTVKDFYGSQYNMMVNNKTDGNPCVTTLFQLFSDSGRAYETGLFTLQNTSNPVILYPGDRTKSPFTGYSGDTIPIFGSIYHRTLSINDDNFPSKILIEGTSSTYTVKAYNSNGTIIWTSDIFSVYVIYDYTFERNNAAIHNVHTDFFKSLNVDATISKTDGTISGNWVPYYPWTMNDTGGVYFLYDKPAFSFGTPIAVSGYDAAGYSQTGGKYNAQAFSDSGTCAITSLENLWNMANLQNTTLSNFEYIEIEFDLQSSWPLLIFNRASTTQLYDSNQNPTYLMVGSSIIGNSSDYTIYTNKITFQRDENNYNYIYLNVYVNGSIADTKRISSSNLLTTLRAWYICYSYTTTNSGGSPLIASFNANVHGEYLGGSGGMTIESGTGYTFSYPSSIANSSLRSPLVALRYTGTEYSAAIGPDQNGLNRTYNAIVPMTFQTHSETGTTYYWNIFSLSNIFNYIKTGLNATDITLDITYDNLPLFTVRGNTWDTSAYSILNGSYVNTYLKTVNDDNIPSKFVWNGKTNIVSVYKNGNVLYSENADNVYMIANISTNNGTQNTASLKGIMNISGIPIDGTTINNSSTYSYSSMKWFAPLNETDTYNHNYFINAYVNYTGEKYASQFSNKRIEGSQAVNIRLENTRTEVNREIPYVTSLDKILNTNYGDYSKIVVNVNYGTHPIFFYLGKWTYSTYDTVIEDPQHGISNTYTYNNYYITVGDETLPDRLEMTTATGNVTAYRGSTILWTSLASEVCVICKYDKSTPSWQDVTNQSATFTMEGIPNLKYAYMDPTKGGTMITNSTTWSNGYENNVIDIVMARVSNAPNELTVTAGNSSITVKTQNNTMTAHLIKHDGTTETKTIGKWSACQIEIDSSQGTVSLTPLSGIINYTNNVPVNGTTTTWTDWYTGGTIQSLLFSTSTTSMKFSVTNTTVFLDTYGVVMQDPSINVNNYFPDYDIWRLNFYSFALVGDSMTINGQTFDIGDDQKITLSHEGQKTITGTLSNIYITEKDGHTFFTFTDSKETIDLGETVDENVSFTGLWYFTTGLYEGVSGVEDYFKWNIDGQYHATITQTCLMFIGLMIVGMIIGRVMFDLSFTSMNGIILITASVIALIVAGGTL